MKTEQHGIEWNPSVKLKWFKNEKGVMALHQLHISSCGNMSKWIEVETIDN